MQSGELSDQREPDARARSGRRGFGAAREELEDRCLVLVRYTGPGVVDPDQHATRIAFDSNGAIYRIPSAGGAKTQLTDGEGDESPSWSPNPSDNRIVFDDHADLYTVVTGTTFRSGLLELRPATGVELFSFTFTA